MKNKKYPDNLPWEVNSDPWDTYDNFECWQIVEAFNKAQIEWVRRTLHGNNLYKEGDEASKRRVDDLQILLTELPLTGTITDQYFQTTNFPPANYLEYKRVKAQATSECCPDPRPLTVYLGEEANVDLYLKDTLKRPDFDWGETFLTMINNTIRIYRRDFNVISPVLVYYREPRRIEFAGVLNPYTGTTSTTDVISEFKDDIVELILDDAAALIAGDIENFNQMQREQQSRKK